MFECRLIEFKLKPSLKKLKKAKENFEINLIFNIF
jgi:hypothetical protein